MIMKKTKDTILIILFNIIIAMCVSFGFLFIVTGIKERISLYISNFNLFIYFFMVVIFLIVYLSSSWLSHKYWHKWEIIENNTVKKITMVLMTIIFSYCLIKSFLNERNMFASFSDTLPWHSGIQEKVTLVIMAAVFALSVFLIKKQYNQNTYRKNKNLNLLLFVFYFVIALIFGYSLYLPNIFSNSYNLHHGHAYLNSICRAIENRPYSEVNSGVYGYYGIILAPFVKLIGGNIYLAIAIVATISFLAIIYALDNLVDNIWIKIVGTLALGLPILSMKPNIYFQAFPHRFFFPSLFCAYIVYYNNKKQHRSFYMLLGYLLSAFAIIWNLEMGIVCSLAWASVFIYENLLLNKIFSFQTYKNIVLHLTLILASFLSAYGIVNIYNICCGGKLIGLSTFVFPLLSKNYITTMLMTDLPMFLSSWIIEIIFLFTCVGFCLSRIKSINVGGGTSGKSSIIFGISVISIGQMSYFINRTTYGALMISYLQVVLLICIVTDICIRYYLKNRESNRLSMGIVESFCYINVTIIVILSLGTISNYYNNEQLIINGNFRNMQKVKELITEMDEAIAENTKGIGTGIPELFNLMGRDAVYYPLDFSDIVLKPQAINYLNNELANLNTPLVIEHESFLLLNTASNDRNRNFLLRNQIYKQFELNGIYFDYYEPKIMDCLYPAKNFGFNCLNQGVYQNEGEFVWIEKEASIPFLIPDLKNSGIEIDYALNEMIFQTNGGKSVDIKVFINEQIMFQNNFKYGEIDNMNQKIYIPGETIAKNDDDVYILRMEIGSSFIPKEVLGSSDERQLSVQLFYAGVEKEES